MWNHCKVEQAERAKQACIRVGVWSQWRCRQGEHTATKSGLLRHLLDLKVLLTSKALELYIALSSISTTNCFAPMFRHKLDRCMMNCGDCLSLFNETLTNWHLIPSIKNSRIRGYWLCATCSNNKVWILNKIARSIIICLSIRVEDALTKSQVTI